MIYSIIQVLLYLLGCYILFMTLYDHYVNKERISVSFKNHIQKIFFNGCIGQIVISLVIGAIFFLLYTLLFDNPIL